MKKREEKLYTLEEAERELKRRDESFLYFIDFMDSVSGLIDFCENDPEFVKKYGDKIIRRH